MAGCFWVSKIANTKPSKPKSSQQSKQKYSQHKNSKCLPKKPAQTPALKLS
ncbi:hypothetical protein [Helicobacter sp. MIT 01-3238]|uniref:hypothetical protein n=1 Tax=Helicobacter sp. MIT 01-3238 TaxID=398627 RepID=UPI0015F199BC|nr:hypothetical protein [Helicobacter sp. MIT 01-3238]